MEQLAVPRTWSLCSSRGGRGSGNRSDQVSPPYLVDVCIWDGPKRRPYLIYSRRGVV